MAQTKSSTSKTSSASGNGSSGYSSTGNGGSSKAGKTSSKKGNSADQSTMLEEFFIDGLKDIYWAEKSLLKALPKMQKASTTDELKQAFEEHLEVTREQITRLEQAFELMGKKPQAKKCEAMAGLTAEAEEIIGSTEGGSLTRDVAMIMAAQKVEHYEIATYGSLKQIAKTLGRQEVSDLMDATLAEEKEADELLTSIAENNINMQAAEEDSDTDSTEQ